MEGYYKRQMLLSLPLLSLLSLLLSSASVSRAASLRHRDDEESAVQAAQKLLDDIATDLSSATAARGDAAAEEEDGAAREPLTPESVARWMRSFSASASASATALPRGEDADAAMQDLREQAALMHRAAAELRAERERLRRDYPTAEDLLDLETARHAKNYTVQVGDNLLSVAHKFGLSVDELYAANRAAIDEHGVKPNTVFQLPYLGALVARAETQVAADPSHNLPQKSVLAWCRRLRSWPANAR